MDFHLLPRTRRRAEAASVALCLAVAGFVALGAGQLGGFSWDRRLLNFTHRHNISDVLTNDVATTTMILGGLIAAAVLALLLRGGRRREALFWVVGLAGLLILDLTLKPLFHRPPIHRAGGGYSFPSGNAMGALGELVALVFVVSGPAILRRVLMILGSAVVVLNSVAIVYLRWHYPSDVLAGWCIAGAWVCALWLVLSRPQAVRRASPSTVS